MPTRYPLKLGRGSQLARRLDFRLVTMDTAPDVAEARLSILQEYYDRWAASVAAKGAAASDKTKALTEGEQGAAAVLANAIKVGPPAAKYNPTITRPNTLLKQSETVHIPNGLRQLPSAAR